MRLSYADIPFRHRAAASRITHRCRLVARKAATGSLPAIWSSHVSRKPELQLAIDDAVDNALAAATVALQQAAYDAAGCAAPHAAVTAADAISQPERGQQPSVAEPDLAIVFCSSTFSSEYERVVGLVRARVPSLTRVVGCSGYGVIGGAQSSAEEVEDAPAISVTLARLPGVSLSGKEA